MRFDFPEQEEAVASIAAIRGVEIRCAALPSGAVEVLAGAAQQQRIVVHVDGSATPDGGRTRSYREVLEHGC